MAKRKADSDEGSPHSKRKKLGQSSVIPQEKRWPAKEIQTSEGLRLLLSSTQLEVDELLQRVRTFKSFLDGVAYSESQGKNIKVPTLLKYLRTQVSPEEEDAPRLVPDVIKIAHHAGQINSENMFSSSVAVLALLLKTISSLHEFRNFGNSLCRLLLLEDHIKLLEHGIGAAKSKEHLISPCLRLLKEIVLFDGGRAAKTVYRLRHITFQRMDVFLAMRSTSKDDERRSRKRPPVRENAISYLLANIRLQSQTAKCYILGQNRWMRSLLSDMESDSPELVSGILDTLRKEVAENKQLPLHVKGRFFDDWTLGRLASMYGYKNDTLEDEQRSVENVVHALLEAVCASPHHGLLAALESKRSRDRQDEDGNEFDDEGNSSNRERVDTRRIQRSVFSFLQRLRPHASILQNDLLLSCFQISPRLLENYFSDQVAFSFDPKLSATWIGYSQFLLGIVQQPLSEEIIRNCIYRDQCSLDPLIHCILPAPLTQKVLSQCFKQKSSLITFFATRILVAAFEKFKAANKMLNSRKHYEKEDLEFPGLEKNSRMMAAFCKRIPRIKDVVVQFKNCLDQNIMLRESISRLLKLYHTETPQLAIEENVDSSLALSNVLIRFQEGELDKLKDGMLLLDLDHLTEIASRSPNMHWWHQTGASPNQGPFPSYCANIGAGMSLSPFTSLLKLHVHRKQNSDRLWEILRCVAEENSIIWPGTPVSGFEVLILSLRTQTTKDIGDVYAFLDNCFRRATKKTVIYADHLNNLVHSALSNGIKGAPRCLPDLLMVTFVEQLPHLIARRPDGLVVAVAYFLRIYIDISALRGVDRDMLVLVRDILIESFTKENECRLIIGKALQEPLDAKVQEAFDSLQETTENLHQISASPKPLNMEIQSEMLVPPGPSAENENHQGLIRWTREDIQDAITDGAIEELILCLCSAHEEIRKQALTGIRAFVGKLEVSLLLLIQIVANNIQPSGYREWQQIGLLAGEVAETADNIGLGRPLPYFAGVLAARLLRVLTDPLHILYEKVNIFLNRGPHWTVEKLPSYWADKVLFNPPTDENSHYQEISWLLDTLIDGLHTPNDMEIYRRCHTVERILTLAASPDLPAMCLEKITDLLFRCTYVEGSTTLITRCGLVSWLSINIGMGDDSMKSKLKMLGRRAYETSEQARVNDWSNGNLEAMLDSLDMSKSE